MWSAKFKDGTVLNQFIVDNEVPFRKVLDKQDELETLSLIFGDYTYTVNLITGIFTFNTQNITFFMTPVDTEKVDLNNLKFQVVYFQRMIQFFNSNMQNIDGGVVFSALGWKATLPSGEIITRYLKVFTNNTFELVTE